MNLSAGRQDAAPSGGLRGGRRRKKKSLLKNSRVWLRGACLILGSGGERDRGEEGGKVWEMETLRTRSGPNQNPPTWSHPRQPLVTSSASRCGGWRFAAVFRGPPRRPRKGMSLAVSAGFRRKRKRVSRASAVSNP